MDAIVSRLESNIADLRHSINNADPDVKLYLDQVLTDELRRLSHIQFGIANRGPTTDYRFFSHQPKVRQRMLDPEEQLRRERLLVSDSFETPDVDDIIYRVNTTHLIYRNRFALLSLKEQQLAHNLNNQLKTELIVQNQNRLRSSRNWAKHHINYVKSAGVRSSTAQYWIIKTATSTSFTISLDQAIDRWLFEVNGILTQIDQAAKTRFPSNVLAQSIFFGVRVIYYLMFAVADETVSWESVMMECPYTPNAINFILSLITTHSCQCTCYTNYILAAAEEFGYRQIQAVSTSGRGNLDHVFPVVVDSGQCVIGLEAGYRNNLTLIIRYYGESTNDPIYSILETIVYRLKFIVLELSSERYVEESSWSRLSSSFRHIATKRLKSGSNLLDMTYVALFAFQMNTTLNIFNTVMSQLLVDVRQNPSTVAQLMTVNRRNSPNIDWESQFVQVPFKPEEQHVLLYFPTVLAQHVEAYNRLTLTLTPETRSLQLLIVSPYLVNTFFIYTGDELELYEPSAGSVERKSIISFRPQVGKISLDLVRINDDLERIIAIIKIHEFSNVIYPADANGILVGSASLDVREYITQELYRVFKVSFNVHK